MDKLTSLEKYVIVPNIGFYGGFVYDGKDIELCDDHDVDAGYDFRVQQKIVDGKLYTDIKRYYTRENGKQVTEISQMEIEVEKGELLVYVEGLGFTIPEHRMCKIGEAIEQYKLVEGIGNDTGIHEEKGTTSD